MKVNEEAQEDPDTIIQIPQADGKVSPQTTGHGAPVSLHEPAPPSPESTLLRRHMTPPQLHTAEAKVKESNPYTPHGGGRLCLAVSCHRPSAKMTGYFGHQSVYPTTLLAFTWRPFHLAFLRPSLWHTHGSLPLCCLTPPGPSLYKLLWPVVVIKEKKA